jgi:hypothetical protein
MTSPASHVTRRDLRFAERQPSDEIKEAMAEHFEALHDLLEQHGERPFGRLELRLHTTVYEWVRER